MLLTHQPKGESMPAPDLLETFIKPYLIEHLGDADAIFLAGSHARVLNGNAAPDSLAKKNSDYDFVILFDTLPARFPAAMFASQWLQIPGQDEPVSIDLKIIDRAYLEYHARHTREVRRFPFLFSMILDAHPLVCKNAATLDELRAMAADFVDAGPAPLGPASIADCTRKLDSLDQALDQATTPRDHAIVALEGLQALAGLRLLAAQDWISPIGRSLVSLRQSQPGEENRLTDAFNKVQGGDTAAYRRASQEILAQLEQHRRADHADSPLLAPIPTDIVAAGESDDSNRKGDKIMLGQYLARLKDADVMEPLRLIELKCVLWLTAKAYLCRRQGETLAYGAEQASRLDAVNGTPLLMPLFDAITRDDLPAMQTCVNAILADQGGVAFSYLERIYIEDLARRRSAAGLDAQSAEPAATGPVLPPPPACMVPPAR